MCQYLLEIRWWSLHTWMETGISRTTAAVVGVKVTDLVGRLAMLMSVESIVRQLHSTGREGGRNGKGGRR
jgi:hypothetical protein